MYIQQRYEVQILDSFGLTGEPNQCGGLYRQQPPDINMCYPPLAWQTYDIYFRAARWDGQGNKIRNALITRGSQRPTDTLELFDSRQDRGGQGGRTTGYAHSAAASQ